MESYEFYKFLEANWPIFIAIAVIVSIAGTIIGKFVEQKREILGNSIVVAFAYMFVCTILFLLVILGHGSNNLLTSRSVGTVTEVNWGDVSTVKLGGKRVAVRGRPDYEIGQEVVIEERWDGQVLACLDECYRVVALGVGNEKVPR